MRGVVVTFAMAVPMKPVSSQSKKGKSRFITILRNEALARFSGREMLQGDLYARIVWFHARQESGDSDNILKPILDALAGVVYRDDHTVVKCVSERIDLRQDYSLSDADVLPEVYDDLISLIGQRRDHILYVEVGIVPLRRVVFGPIDGGAR